MTLSQTSVYTLWKKHRAKICLCLLTAALCAVYAGVLANKTFPPSEGWYTYYAYLINEEGAVPYVDFELLFPPLYTYLIAFLAKVFGYAIMPLRIFGVIVYVLTGVFAFLIFDKLTKNPWLGFLGGLLTIATLQSEIVQIFYDYIRLMDLNVFVSVYFFLRYVDRFRPEGEQRIRPDVNVLIGTVFAVLASMYKQSSGLIYLLFCFAFVIFMMLCLPRKKELLSQLCVMLGTTAVMYGAMFAFLASKGAFRQYLHYNFVSSVDAKGGGSILSLLFGWIPRSGESLLEGALLLLVPIALLLAFAWLSRKYPAKSDEVCPAFARVCKALLPVLAVLVTVLPLFWRAYALKIVENLDSKIMFTVFLFGTIFFVLSAFALIFRKKLPIKDPVRHHKYLFLSGVIFALAFSVCTSGGLVESQTSLGYAFLPIVLLSALSFRKREAMALLLALFMLLQASFGFSRKILSTYSWWGLNSGDLWEQTETCDVPILKGIKMTPAYAQMYDNVYRGVTAHTDSSDEIFVFPHMPVLYAATDRSRATNTAIQWFDVSTDAAILEDIELLREKKPRVLVLCRIGDGIIEAHEASFRNGEKSGLHEMQDFLYEFVKEEQYDCISQNKISGEYVVTVWVAPTQS